jgi:hypothetical protein
MKKVIVIGKTDSIINLNKIGVPVRGKTRAILNIFNADQEGELMGIVRAGLLEIVPDEIQPFIPPPRAYHITDDKERASNKKSENKEPEKPTEKKKGGRPKGSKNKTKDAPVKNTLAEEEHRRISRAEAETQKMGSRVIIGTLDGAKEGRMTRSAVNDIIDSEQTRLSIEAMEKLEREEKEEINLPDTQPDESKLDASEQMGRKSVIATEAGVEKVDLVNSILPESIANKKADPFIDRKDKDAAMKADVEAAIEKAREEVKDDDDNKIDDSFIEI